MRFFSTLFVLFMVFFAGSVSAQQGMNGPPPPVDEYNNIPPGIFLPPDGDTAPAADASSPAATPDAAVPPAEEDVVTMDDLTAAYNKGQYDMVAKHIIPIAAGNYPQAEEMLGIMYDKGQGVAKDPQNAIVWLTKASEANRPLAEHYLAIMNFTGDGMSPDPVKALMWLYIAIATYTDGPEKSRAVEDRDNVSAQLSRRDRARAFDLAHDWLDKKGRAATLSDQAAPQ